MQSRVLGIRRWAPLGVSFAIVVAITSSPSAAILGADQGVDAAMLAERAVYGLPTDSAAIRALAADDVGTPQWGVAMTSSESSLVNMNARISFADAVDLVVLPALRKLPSFGGAWIDQLNDGELVVQLTKDEPEAKAAATARLPEQSRGLRFETVMHSEADLVGALSIASDLWTKWSSVRPISMAVDTPQNALIVEVLDVDAAVAKADAASIADAVGISIAVDSSAISRPTDIACTDREHCSDPYEAGVLIHEGGTSGEPPCTLAFPIVVGTDIQVLTAGHCAYYGSVWYHKGEGRVGSVQANQWQANGRDILRLSMYDVQASESVYGFVSPPSWNPEQYNAINGYPIANETLCVSLGRSNRSDCGTVTSTAKKYWSDTIGFWVFGANMNGLTPQPIDGDSGSPVHRSYEYTGPGTPHWRHTAVGVLTTEFGDFAKINDSLAVWNATIWAG